MFTNKTPLAKTIERYKNIIFILIMFPANIFHEKCGKLYRMDILKKGLLKNMSLQKTLLLFIFARRNTGKIFKNLYKMRLIRKVTTVANFSQGKVWILHQSEAFEIILILDNMQGIHPGQLIKFPGKLAW